MEPLFENETKYTKESYEKFLVAYDKKYGKKYKRGTIIFIIAMAYFSIMNIAYVKDIKIIIALVLMLLAAVYYRVISQRKIVEKELESDKFQNEQVFTFKFYEETININNVTEEQDIGYYRIYSIQDTDEYIYLYLDTRNALILEKAGFKNVEIEEFIKFLKHKLKNKLNNRIKIIKKRKELHL